MISLRFEKYLGQNNPNQKDFILRRTTDESCLWIGFAFAFDETERHATVFLEKITCGDPRMGVI